MPSSSANSEMIGTARCFASSAQCIKDSHPKQVSKSPTAACSGNR